MFKIIILFFILYFIIVPLFIAFLFAGLTVDGIKKTYKVIFGENLK